MTNVQTINARYQLNQKIGQGGMGIVYRAYDRLMKQTVALKQVLLDPAQLQFGTNLISNEGQSSIANRNPRLALAKEFKALASLRHPNIISVLDYGFDVRGQPFFTMDLVEHAQPVTAYSQMIPVADRYACLLQVLEALIYLHQRRVIHRDIKPDNVLVTQDNQTQKPHIKVMDFGLAYTPDDNSSDKFTLSGTLAYMAPELFQGGQVNIQSDLYAVGLIAYEMFTGYYPFSQNNLTQLLMQIAQGQIDTTMLSADLADWLDTMLSKDPTQRPASAIVALETFCQAVNYPQPPEAQAIRESYLQASNFVGRDNELAQLQAGLRTIRQPTNAFYLVGGESGVGKSRLIDEIRTLALVDGVQVLRGQAVDGGGLPFQVWRSVLRPLLLTIEATPLELSILKAIIPDLNELLDQEIEAIPELSGKAHQNRLVLTITTLFTRLRQPVLVILEDLQWISESVLVLQQMLKVTDQLPHLMIIGTYRNDERYDLPNELEGFTVITLERLKRRAIAELSYAMLGEAGRNPTLVDLLATQTEGNTLFMVEVVRTLAEEAGRLRDIARMTLPQRILTGGMQAILERRLAQVDANYLPLLQAAALIGREIDQLLLGQIYPNTDIAPFLYQAQAAAVFMVQDDQWQFAHDKLREATLQSILPDDKTRLHRAIASAMEAVYPDNADYNEVLLEHWHQANDLDKELVYLVPVVEQMVNITGNYEQAQVLIERGLRALTTDDGRILPLLLWQATAYERQTAYETAYGIAQRAYELAQTMDGPRDLARSLELLALMAFRQDDYDLAHTYYNRALDIRSNIGYQRGMATSFSNLGLLALHQGQYDHAHAYFSEALEIAQVMGDQHRIAQNFVNLGNVAYAIGEYAQAQQDYLWGLSILRAIGDQYGIAVSLTGLATITQVQGDSEQAQQYYEESITIQKMLGDRRGIAINYNNLGQTHYITGDYEQARAYFEQSLAISRTLNNRFNIANTLGNLGFIDLNLKQRPQPEIVPMFHEGLASAKSIHATSLLLELLIGFAWMFLNDHQDTRAAELIGLAQHHPASNHDVITRLDELKTHWPDILQDETTQAALERGKTRDLDTVVDELLVEFTNYQP